MPFQCIHPDKLYEKDPNLKREDIQNLREWLCRQPHLPELEEMQLICFLHGCYYRLEPTKVAIDSYFTVKTHCSSDFLSILNEDDLKQTLSVGFLNILPKKTPKNYSIMLLKLTDFQTENFNFLNIVRAINMICTLHLHQNGYDHGGVVIMDMEGATLGHLTKVNLMTLKKALYHLQEGAPVRLKSIHFINVISFIDTVNAIAKHLLKQEIYNMLKFHSNDSIEDLYKYVPQECLPKEYGGAAPSISTLNEICLKNLTNNFDFFGWHAAQIVDESKRIGNPKDPSALFGVEGSFKKLEID